MKTIWEDIKNFFTTEENWGDALAVSGFTLLFLHGLRKETGWPIVIHNAVEYSGHTDGSQHYKKTAVDWHFLTDTPYKDQIDKVIGYANKKQFAQFMGIGIYPEWNNPGFHTDTRGVMARWGFLDNGLRTVQVGWDQAYKKAGEI